jgi:predicted alpha/beta-hydrolase family hydrolase
VSELVPTPSGNARITWFRASSPRAVLALGHGASTGVDARDLQALADVLPGRGVEVVLVEQPWLVAGGARGADNAALDGAWRAVWPRFATEGLLVIAGGRSAGSRVAARTAVELGAHAVLALSFPLHGFGRPQDMWDHRELYDTGLPTLVVQGGEDPFGRPAAFPPLPPLASLVEIPGADHVFAVPGGQDRALALITDTVADWVLTLAGTAPAGR